MQVDGLTCWSSCCRPIVVLTNSTYWVMSVHATEAESGLEVNPICTDAETGVVVGPGVTDPPPLPSYWVDESKMVEES